LRNPSSRPDDRGAVTRGFYILDGNKITMTDSSGTPIRRGTGDLYTHVLKADENEATWAGILTKQIRTSIRGNKLRGFDGPLDYGPTGWR
jgi:hypothetical protein